MGFHIFFQPFLKNLIFVYIGEIKKTIEIQAKSFKRILCNKISILGQIRKQISAKRRNSFVLKFGTISGILRSNIYNTFFFFDYRSK